MYGLWLFKELKTEYGNCKVELYRKGYTASAVEIGGFVGNSLNLALENLDTITAPIGKSVCSFAIYDTEQVEYDDLFTPDATAYKVVISTKVDGGEYNTRWSGYVTPDFFAENLSFRTPISISARDNIGYLNDVDFNLDVATITVRELIQAAFRKIAEDYPMNLSFVTQKQTEEGILAIDATISTYLLREMSWYEALETILHDLGLQMRWVDNNTIAVLDLSQIPEYYTTQSFNFVDASGYREIAPAWRELSQEQNYGVRENFFEGWLREDNITFVKTENIRIPLSMGGVTGLVPMRYYTPNNWGVAGNTFVINPKDYVYFGTYGQMAQPFGERIFFTGVEKDATNIANNYMSYRQDVYASNRPMRVTFKAFTSVMATGGIGNNDALLAYDPANRFMDFATGDTLQLGLKVNLLLHVGTRTYILGQNWEEINGAETNSLYFVLPKIGQVDGSSVTPNEEEITIDVNTIPNDGVLELRIYGFTIHNKTNLQEDAGSATYDWLRMVSYINEVKYTYNIDNPDTGRFSQVEVNKQHNIKDTQSYTFGQIPVEGGAVNAFAGGLFKADGNELIGFQRNADATNYNLLELVGREIIHFNKKNYNKLSGTIKNLAKEPLRFDRMFIYKGKNYLPFAYSLDVISNTMNITTMQEVEPYTTHSFVEIKSELVTGGGATISGGNNTALQYSAEVGNAKRISELNNASESEKKESYIVIDNANWNESKKVPLSEMEGLDEAQVEAYLTENKYAKQSWVKGITDDLETDIAKRVLIEDFDKLQEAVDLNYANLNKATTRISTLEGYFSNGVANNAAKLGGQLPSYYATKSALDTTNTNLSNLSTTVGTIAGNLSNLTGRVSTAEETIKGHTSSISEAVADIAANAKNISTNATNITTVANRVKTLEDLGFILKDGYIYTEKTIVSKGEIISGRRASGTSTDVGGGGISSITAQMVADALGYVPYSSANPAGYINSSALNGYAKLTDIPSLSGYATEQYVTSRGYITGISSKMVTDALGYTPYNSANFTKANIKSTLGIADWALAASKPSYSWGEITGKPSFATVATSGKYSDLSGVPTSLPASDVYAWAKKSSLALADVPDLSSKYAAVGLAGTSRYLAIPNGGYIFTRGGVDWNITNGDWSASYKILHEGNYADTTDKRYLQLSGGTINGNLIIGNVDNTEYKYLQLIRLGHGVRLNNTNVASVLAFGAVDNTGYMTAEKYIEMGDNGLIYSPDNTNRYTLIHSGNIGSQSVDRAIALRGRYPSVTSTNDFYNTEQLIKYHAGFSPEFGNVPSSNSWQNGLLEIGLHSGGASAQFFFSAYKRLYYRSHQTDAWHGVAYLTDNVASATKLQTARTIWGQSFDGTGNVSGVMTGVNTIHFGSQPYGNSGVYQGNWYAEGWTDRDIVLAFDKTHISGNVLIGTTADNGAKLQVSGNLTATGEVISSRRASSSDRRLKNNITYLDTADCLAMIRHVRPAEWDWKDNGKHSMGFIAQDVEHLMPYAVTKIKDEVLEQRLNLQYDQFFAPVVGAIQCLDSEVEQLKRRVKYLENKLQKYGYNRY